MAAWRKSLTCYTAKTMTRISDKVGWMRRKLTLISYSTTDADAQRLDGMFREGLSGLTSNIWPSEHHLFVITNHEQLHSEDTHRDL